MLIRVVPKGGHISQSLLWTRQSSERALDLQSIFWFGAGGWRGMGGVFSGSEEHSEVTPDGAW